MLAKEIVTLVKHILKKLYDSIKTIWAEKPDRYYEIDGFRLDMGEGAYVVPYTKKVFNV